jgi:8-oxo-dGTP pyrophosphatase MutT (NUDIX family)
MARMNRKIHEVCSSAILIRDNKFVLLYDHNKNHYVLPQGHKRKKEILSETALREAREETGFQNLSTVRKLGRYQYHFDQGRKTIYKTIHVYLIRVTNGKQLKNTQNASEDFSAHILSFKKAIEVVRWKQDKKFISLARKFLKI